MWHRLESIAVGCSSRAVMPLLRIEWSILLHTLQQRLPMLFNGPNDPQNCPFSCGGLDPDLIVVPLAHMSQPPNGISIGSPVFAQLTGVPITDTHRHTDHATCDICSNRPHLCTACKQCGLKSNVRIFRLYDTHQYQQRELSDTRFNLSCCPPNLRRSC